MGKRLPYFLSGFIFLFCFSAMTVLVPCTAFSQSSGVIINEFLTAPPDGSLLNGDANGDGNVSEDDDQFIEIVNSSGRDIDISGWQFSNDGGENIIYTFPSGTVLSANRAAVVFGGGNPRGNFGGALVQTAGSLDLEDGGGKIRLSDDQNNIIQEISYGDEADNDQALTRDPDGTGDFVQHTAASGRLLTRRFSPGTQTDGSSFSSTFATAFRGTEGYRFFSTPARNTSFNDLFGDLRTQGIPNSDIPTSPNNANIFGWQETDGGAFSAIPNMNMSLSAGQGYIIFVFEDDNGRTPEVEGGFPKIINTDRDENNSPVRVNVSATDSDDSGSINGKEGYNLLGNPYGTDVSVGAILEALEEVDPSVNMNISVWDYELGGGNGGYRNLSDGDRLAPFQAFFVRYTAGGVSGNASFDRSDLTANQGAQFFGQSGETQREISFEMYLDDGDKFDTYEVQFGENGTIGEDRYDAYKLFSLNADAISFFSEVGDGAKLAKNVLPSLGLLEKEGELRIPLAYNVPRSGEYTIRWSELDQIPEQIELILVDKVTGRRTEMETDGQYQFNITRQEQSATASNKISPTLTEAGSAINNERFELILSSSAVDENKNESEELEQPVELSTNYPNPFRSKTTMDLRLREKMHVNVTVWNIVGQKVGTMRDEQMDAGGPYPLTWNVPANMPSGIYICKVEAGGMVLTRKMTLVK